MDPVPLVAELWFEAEPRIPPSPPLTVTAGSGDAPSTAQTWDWAEADAVLARCGHFLRATERGDGSYDERIAGFLPALRSLVEQTEPLAVWCPNSARLVRPGELLEDELSAFVNVRMFRVEDTGALLMDTLGLHALGLPDVQCRYADEEPSAIAAMLYDLAAYLLDRGDVIRDGDTVGDLPWRCHDAVALVAPARRMLDLTTA